MDKAHQRVAIKLIRVRDGASLFAQNYDEKLDNIFQFEESLCPKVLANLLVNLDHEETQRLRKRYTENPQAYEAFLKAHYFMGKATKEDTEKGIDYFKQAIDLDPKYAMAYAGLSDCYMKLGGYGVPPTEFVPVSRAAVMKALELDDTVAYSHSMLGRIAFQYDWDFPRAESEYARARQLEPSLVHAWYSNYLLTINRMPEAEVEYRKFEDFLPFSPANINLAQYFYLTRQYDQAVALLARKLEINPNFAPTHEWLGMVYEQQGRTRQAIEEFQKASQLSNGARGLGALGHLYAVTGKKNEARKALLDLEALSKRTYVSSYQKAVIYAALGVKDEGFRYLQKSFDERSLLGPLLRLDPRLHELRDDPRFQDLMRRAGMVK
jgi:tetratricopeptide (TPR) repeat protein